MKTWTPQRIADLRHAYGETQEEFALRFRISPWGLRVWEQGKGPPSGPATIILDQLQEQIQTAASR